MDRGSEVSCEGGAEVRCGRGENFLWNSCRGDLWTGGAELSCGWQVQK